jgi:hypothetical protein
MNQADEKMALVQDHHTRLRQDMAVRRDAFQQVRIAMESAGTSLSPALREALTNMGKSLISSVQAEEGQEE